MSEERIVKGILIEDGEVAKYDYRSLANVPKVQNAEVGMFLRVKEVDELGNAKSVEAVSMSDSSNSTQNGIYILSDGETLEDVPDDADLVIDPNGEADEETVTGDYIPVPTTAEVGQTIVVKEVDESGKPTAWEAVDMAGGADDKWELIAEATIDEWVSIITIDKDSEGNTFSLKKMVVALTLPVCTLEDGTTANTGYTHYQINKQGTWQGPSTGWENAQFWFEIELVSNWLTVRCYKSSGTYNSSLWNAFNLALSEAVDSNALTSFTYKNFNTTCGYDGCSYKVYGVRA